MHAKTGVGLRVGHMFAKLRLLFLGGLLILGGIGISLVGLILAVTVGLILCDAHSVSTDELRAAVRAGWAGRVGLFVAASLAACVAGNWVATWGVRRRPPAEALTLSG